MTNWTRSVCLVAFLGVTACGGGPIVLTPTTPAASAQTAKASGVSKVTVEIDSGMPPDRTAILEKLDAPAQLEQAVLASFSSAGQQKPDGVTMEIQIHIYSLAGSFKPVARMGVKVTVRDAGGNVVETFERQTTSVRGGSKKSQTQRLAQDLVQRIVDET